MESDKKVNHAASHHIATFSKIKRTANKVSRRAKANLEQHRNEGHAHITLERGSRPAARNVDLLVVLTDERGLGAAMSIEYGREEGTTSSWGPMEATDILHDAARIRGRSKGLRKRSVRDEAKGRGSD